MLSKIVEALFGCSHANYSFPRTTKPIRNKNGLATARTYVVCLDCGKALPYDWREMKLILSDNKAA
jgi:hypothetical protein